MLFYLRLGHLLDAHFQFTVSQQQNNLGLLECLLPAIPYLQPEQWQNLLAGGLVSINDQVVVEDGPLKQGQDVQYIVPDYSEAYVDTAWKTLWENESIAAVHKPANLPVSRTTRNVYNTLIQLLRRESPWPDAHLLHRLDLETSGIILIAKTNDVAKQFQSKLPQLMKRKIYRAVVHGEPQWQQLRHSSYLNTKKDSPIRCQMHEVEQEQGKLSETNFTVLKTNNGYCVIECELFTGRKHQIRAHLSQLGHPIVGDKIYSQQGEYYLKRLSDALTEQDIQAWPCEHHLLHAYDVHLNDLFSEQGGEIKIHDEQYSEHWLRFCKTNGLT